MIGNWIKKALGYGVEVGADAAIITGIPALINWFKKTHSSLPPDLQEELKKWAMKITTDGRTRTDELVFFASLTTLKNVSAENKVLFLKKHYELIHPDFSGKTPDEIKELERKEKFAKGVVFLIAADPTAGNIDPGKRFVFSKDVWYSIFMGVDAIPDNDAKLLFLEERIIHCGKNNQERITLEEMARKANPTLERIGSATDGFRQSSETALADFQNRPLLRKIFFN